MTLVLSTQAQENEYLLITRLNLQIIWIVVNQLQDLLSDLADHLN
jgi:hypothetical protein